MFLPMSYKNSLQQNHKKSPFCVFERGEMASLVNSIVRK